MIHNYYMYFNFAVVNKITDIFPDVIKYNPQII